MGLLSGNIHAIHYRSNLSGGMTGTLNFTGEANIGVGRVSSTIPLWSLCNYTIVTPPPQNPVLIIKAPKVALNPKP